MSDWARFLMITTQAAALFIPDGMVTGTERAERWLLWPMEIQNPGAMQ